MTDEVPFRNREIKEMFDDIKKELTEIKEQTTKTNGRVGSLEVWRGFILGGLAILALLVVPVLIAVIKNVV